MLELSPETEALARRLGEARGLSVDAAVRDALETSERSAPAVAKPEKNMSSDAIAARIAAMDKIVAEIKALPILDPRPIQEIIDDINEI